VGNEGGPPARPDAAGQADAALEHRRAAQRFEIVEPGAWRPPDLDAAEAVGVSIDLPQRAVLPAERRADGFEDARGRVGEASRFRKGARRRVLGGLTPRGSGLVSPGSTDDVHVERILVPDVHSMCLANQRHRKECSNVGPMLTWLKVDCKEEVDELY